METKMWEVLPNKDKEEYKKMILAFASLSEMFTQKATGSNEVVTPIINSKFQETVFQKAFHAIAEDIGNTSYDVSLKVNTDGKEYKYLIGIKTFGFTSGDQKVAQFKAYQPNYLSFIESIEKNTKDKELEKGEIEELNNSNYLHIAKSISEIRNKRIDSSIENLKGFKIEDNDNVLSVYHVLMPSKKDDIPQIYVGETNYDKIDIENISILGCTNKKNPTNFSFTDGKHVYKYTSSDSQLYMKFNNSDIIKDTWDVKYADDAYEIFSDIANKIYGTKNRNTEISESYSWSLLNSKGEVELFSAFNSFYGVGPKIPTNQREPRADRICEKYKEVLGENVHKFNDKLKKFLVEKANNDDDRKNKAVLRDEIIQMIRETDDKNFMNEMNNVLFRNLDEVYIPIPNSKKFHHQNPNFFGESIGTFTFNKEKNKEERSLALPKEDRKFNLIFEPSGDSIISFIAQDNGKAIESYEKQSYLGKWLLRKVFQLSEYEPLTADKLNEIGINGVRLYKEKNSKDVHIQFIWIDENNLPSDYFE